VEANRVVPVVDQPVALCSGERFEILPVPGREEDGVRHGFEGGSLLFDGLFDERRHRCSFEGSG